MYKLNYGIKLNQIESLLNCWRARNLYLIGNICVQKDGDKGCIFARSSKLHNQFFKHFNAPVFTMAAENAHYRCAVNLRSKQFRFYLYLCTIVPNRRIWGFTTLSSRGRGW